MARLYQISTSSAFKKGVYGYSITLEHFLRHGTLGFGTFNGFNGEAIVIDKKAYNATASGTVKEMTIPQTGVSFGYMTHFKPNLEPLKLNDVNSYEELKTKLHSIMKYGENYFYFVRIDGKFSNIKVRSVYKQVKPFKPLEEVLKEQVTFDYENEEGTLIGLFTPSEMKETSFEGWHFHYISNDRTHGGHVLDVKVSDATAQSMFITTYELKLPNNMLFRNDGEEN